MTLGQREKIVLHMIRAPTRRHHIVAFLTIGRKPRLHVVWIGARIVIRQVTANAIIPQTLKLQGRCRLVALGTIEPLVYAIQRKSALQMQL